MLCLCALSILPLLGIAIGEPEYLSTQIALNGTAVEAGLYRVAGVHFSRVNLILEVRVLPHILADGIGCDTDGLGSLPAELTLPQIGQVVCEPCLGELVFCSQENTSICLRWIKYITALQYSVSRYYFETNITVTKVSGCVKDAYKRVRDL